MRYIFCSLSKIGLINGAMAKCRHSQVDKKHSMFYTSFKLQTIDIGIKIHAVREAFKKEKKSVDFFHTSRKASLIHMSSSHKMTPFLASKMAWVCRVATFIRRYIYQTYPIFTTNPQLEYISQQQWTTSCRFRRGMDLQNV